MKQNPPEASPESEPQPRSERRGQRPEPPYRAWAEQQVHHLATLLGARLRAAGLTLRQAEKRLGVGRGYLTQVLRGRVQLKPTHYFALAELLQLNEARFFADLFGPGGTASAAPAAAPGASPAPPLEPSPEALRRAVKQLVRECLADQRGRTP